MVVGQWRGRRVKHSLSSGMVYTLHRQVEFTFNYQVIPHNPFRHVLMTVWNTLNIIGLQSLMNEKLR